ncbi:MAG TPA: Nif3-like dinuclear metal center hexameric protein [Bacteroidetes bacterium]|nr:Nif3-like dinuclear metal center hexameric protein [Bacteroidota bacterium]
MLKIKSIANSLEQWAPPSLALSYDNCGLLVGDPNQTIDKALVTLDVTEAVVQEAIEQQANLIIAHHPVIFKGLRSIRPTTDNQRAVILAIKHDIAIYAIHTNLDRVDDGVNKALADQLNLTNRSILEEASNLYKLITFVPTKDLPAVRNALFAIGAGGIGNYEKASFISSGFGSFQGNSSSSPSIGKAGEFKEVEEEKLEVLLTDTLLPSALNTLNENHPYEEIAYDVLSLQNKNKNHGSGMIGELSEALSSDDFIQYLKKHLGIQLVRHSQPIKNKIKRVAICGGAGFDLLKNAKQKGADAFLTADLKYHDFFEADDSLLLCDIGHYESEHWVIQEIKDFLTRNFANFDLLSTTVNTNPVHYSISIKDGKGKKD